MQGGVQRAARACCDNLPHDLNSFTLCFFFLLLTVINTFSLLFFPLRHSLQLKPLTLSLSLILTPCSFPFPSLSPHPHPPNFIHFSLFHSQSFLTDIIHVAFMSVIYKDLDTNLEFLISCLLLAEVLSSFIFKQEKTRPVYYTLSAFILKSTRCQRFVAKCLNSRLS